MAIYYVDNTNGSNENDGAIETPWETVGKANLTLTAGDTVYIRTGNYYGDYINPINTGTSDINRITYSNYNNEIVTIRDASYGIRINGKSYITVNGIACFNLDHFFHIENSADYNIIKYCTFDLMRTQTWAGSRVWGNSTYNHIHHNTFSRWGNLSGGSDDGTLFDIGNWSLTTDHSDYNLVEYNTFLKGGHHLFSANSKFNVIRHNYFHNESWTVCDRAAGICGNRCGLSEGYAAGSNLWQNNIFAFAGLPPDDFGAVGIKLATPDNIVRNNTFYECGGSGISFESESVNIPDDDRVYNNTIYHNGYLTGVPTAVTYGMVFADWGDGDMVDNVVKNNIFYLNKGGAIGATGVSLGLQIIENNWEEAGDPKFVDISAEPDPDNPALYDFRLQASSAAINAGAFLTTANGSGSSSTTLIVDDAKYFMDGWGIIDGDTIQLEGQEITAVIIDITNNTLTLDTALTWSDEDGVTLPYINSSPDLGAFQYEEPSLPEPPGLEWIEAESDIIVAPMISVADGAASGGQYIHSTIENTGTAILSFNLPSAGYYKFIAEVYVLAGSSDSFFVKIDNELEDIWDIFRGNSDHHGAWNTDNITFRGNGSFDNAEFNPYIVYLDSGDHTIRFRGREALTRLDRFYAAFAFTSFGRGSARGILQGVLRGVI